ncbi:hypothetical protein J6X15_03565 [Candidatus Saccharibacteria bacterium]|nr:hypothetical protein [Candidatus Saccharibacteria bacterium]
MTKYKNSTSTNKRTRLENQMNGRRATAIAWGSFVINIIIMCLYSYLSFLTAKHAQRIIMGRGGSFDGAVVVLFPYLAAFSGIVLAAINIYAAVRQPYIRYAKNSKTVSYLYRDLLLMDIFYLLFPMLPLVFSDVPVILMILCLFQWGVMIALALSPFNFRHRSAISAEKTKRYSHALYFFAVLQILAFIVVVFMNI